MTHYSAALESGSLFASKRPLLHARPVRPLDAEESSTSPESPSSSGEDDHSINSSNASGDMEEEFNENECKYDDDELLKTHTPLLTGPSVHEKREEIRDYFHRTFSLYEKLFSVLASDETFPMQPEMLRHPLIFYFGHTAVFFINKLRLAGLLNQRINESLESTLAIGVDEMSWDDLNVGNYKWPSVDQVRKYRDLCRVVVDDLISSLPLSLPITWDQPFWVILMGCEHERIHLETSSVLFRQLPIDQVKAVPMWSACTQFRACAEDVPENELLPVPEGDVVAGKTEENQESYGWDNEYGSFSAHTSSFRASKFLCSNSEFSEFVRSGGYEDPTLWGEEGWKFVQFRKAQAPVFWVPVEQQVDSPADQQHSSELPKKDGSALAQTGGKSEDKTASPPRAPVTYRYRTMTTIIDMPWDWPVDCNYIEAKAWCTWKNRQRKLKGEAVDGLEIRMPSEAEYLRFREHAFPTVDPKTGVKNDQPYWTSAPGNINMEHGLSSCPIDTWRFEHGFYDVIGNVWQWTETPIMPLRGFKFHPLYDDFSVPTFDTRHNIFCGGSWASTGNEATRAARYAFRRHFYQHAGFRYILAAPLPITDVATTAMCETDPAVTLMMDAQFNDAAAEKVARQLGMKMQNYSVRFAELAVAAYKAYGRTGSVHSESKATGSPSPSSEEASSASPTSPSTTLLGSGPRALDLGCACGRSTFEIAKLSAPSSTEGGAPLFDHILGLDFSTRFIRIAAQLQFEQHAEYSMKKEGELISYHSIESKPAAELSKSAIPEDSSVLDLDLVSRGMQERVEFMQADACNLGAKYTGFDLVLAANLLDYLYSPAAFLTSISSRMRRGGILVLASSYSWDEAYTPRDQWLGGRKDGGGESVESSRTISELLSSQFEAISEASQEVPMMWKQNARNFQIKIAHTTVWRKL